jgi:hypothetical protein
MKANAIPVLEDQDLADADGDAIEVTTRSRDNAIGDEDKHKESKVGKQRGKGKEESDE